MKLLSIDPGYERIGIAIIEHRQKEKDVLVYSTCFKTSAKLPFYERLKIIGKEIQKLIKKYKPEALAIEKLYFAANHKQLWGYPKLEELYLLFFLCGLVYI